jgi:SulP family sulfate permease
MAIVIGFGFVMGVVVGLVVTIIVFALNYSRIPVARYSLSGASLSSHRKRSLNQERLLQGKGDQVYVLPLQGYIFFGSATNLVSQIRQRVQSSELPPPRWVLLDFQQVTGVDSSAIVSFIKLKQMARKNQFQIGLTGLSADLDPALQQGGILVADDPICQAFPDLDRGMEWCETQLLESSKYRRPRSLPLSLQLKTFLTDDNEQISTLMQYLTPLQLKTGEAVFHQGDQPDALYFIESGDIETVSHIPPSHSRRLQQLGSGTLLGEVEFFTQEPYRFSAIADQNSKLYTLSRNQLIQLQTENPQVATLLSQFINELLATRLTDTQRELINIAH